MNRQEKIKVLREIAAGIKVPQAAILKIFLYQNGKLSQMNEKGELYKEIDPDELPQISSPADILITLHESDQPGFNFEAQKIVCDSFATASEFARLIKATTKGII